MTGIDKLMIIFMIIGIVVLAILFIVSQIGLEWILRKLDKYSEEIHGDKENGNIKSVNSSL